MKTLVNRYSQGNLSVSVFSGQVESLASVTLYQQRIPCKN